MTSFIPRPPPADSEMLSLALLGTTLIQSDADNFQELVHHHIWSKFWMRSGVETILPSSSVELEGTVIPLGLDPVMHRWGPRVEEITVWPEYILLLQTIHKKRQIDNPYLRPGGVFVIEEKSGMGKTVFLWLYLLLSLQAQEPVFFYHQDVLFLYSASGVHVFETSQRIQKALRSPTLRLITLLVDMDSLSPDARYTLLGTAPFAIGGASTSAEVEDYRTWRKQSCMHTLVVEFYDPTSASEQPVALPSAPQTILAEGIVLQPPLSRRGTGPGIVAFLPPDSAFQLSSKPAPLDPPPTVKWAEEGYAVVGIVGGDVASNLKIALNAFLALQELDTKDKFAVLVYDPTVLPRVVSALEGDKRLVCLVVYGHPLPADATMTVPTLVFLPSGNKSAAAANVTACVVDSPSPAFVFPRSAQFHTAAASIAHSKALAFIKKHVGGPYFDLEAIWEEHTYFEFEVRSVAQTMGTMVAEPYVNHVPTLAGGIGRKNLSAFYRDHFVFSNPRDTVLQSVSRTVGGDRVVDEFIFHCTHDRQIDWLLPQVPPTGKKLAIPMLGVINIRGDRLYHEHIWWDQGTVCLQAGLMPTHVQMEGKSLRLPIAGAESAALLVDECAVAPNQMLGPAYGFVQDA
uniref:Dienelactone hydrolase n=1 Tax=Mycena chlorophos TaxID=658473 RepID=A0ABQ0L4X7_MYCCL|nr:predicted protein [Mycena chlorophos]